MTMEKLRIIVEKPKGAGKTPQFDNGTYVEALFNPDKLVFNKTANWQKQAAKNHDSPELQFTNSDPGTLTIDLLFDTYDTPDAKKKDVRREYTDKVMKLIVIDGEKHRPPVCRLAWGSQRIFFQGVLQSLAQQFILFTEEGTPVRARLNCTFKEWYTNYEDLNRADMRSSDLAKIWTVKRGDTLSRIAAIEYSDPSLWRPIAEENGIDDPADLAAGRVLAIPALPYRKA